MKMDLWKNVIETELCLLCNLRLSLYCRPMLPQHPDWDYSWSTGYKDQKYLPDDNVRQEGSYKGDQGEKPNPRGGQCVQIYLRWERGKPSVKKRSLKPSEAPISHVECIWIHRGSWLLIRVIVSSKPIEDPCVDQHHLKIKDGQAIVQELCFTIQKLFFDNTCYLC